MLKEKMHRRYKVKVVTLLEGLPFSLTYCGPPVKVKFFMQSSGFAEISIEYITGIKNIQSTFANICIMATILQKVTSCENYHHLIKLQFYISQLIEGMQ